MLPDSSWTTGPRPALRDEGLHEAFGRVAAVRPDAAAVVSSRRTVTYGELDGIADAWAAALVEVGVARGDLVPIALPRSVELVAALLAVLKAGAAYALLDPSWPARRRHEIVDQLDAPLLIGGPGPDDHEPRAAAPATVPVWTPPAAPAPAVAPAGFRPAAVTGSDPCCVFFTSGTTGRPKGVLTPHRATARLFQPESFARFAAGTVVPLAAPVPWDAFSLELWSVLLTGGTSLIVEEPYLSAGSLRAAVSRHGADTVWLTSSLFNMVVDEDPGAFRGLRQLMIGGERLSPGHVARFLRHHPGIVLLNGYGPVESTVFATTHRITEADCARPGGIPLGRPVPGTQVYVMDVDGSGRCAVGETGEICVAGDGLALRYLGDAALTAAKFTRVRIDGEERRVYRTGDLGVWDGDGLLHFRGRADRQLKIRGHRIEPAEVERQIEELLPSVRQCRVLARRGDDGVPQDLVAFCVPAAPGDPLAGVLPAVRAALVSYHRPAAVVSVPTFPVTDRGKLDERALLALAPVPAPASPETQAPAGDATIRAVAETFGAVLGRASVPLDVPFVELGGTSLGAGRVCARLAARLGRPVPVSRLYRHPTVASLAGWLRTLDDGAAAAREPAAARAPGETPLTPMQVVYLTRHLVDPADLTGHCLLVWAIEGRLDRAALEGAIAAVHDRHPALRAAYVPDPRPAALAVDIPPPALEELPARPSVDAALAALRAELTGPLEPIDGDVWRTVLAPVAAGAVTLFGCVVHHIAFDGWSESVLAADLAAGYAAAAARPAAAGGSAAPPVPLPRPTRPDPVPPAPAGTADAGPAARAELAAHGEYLRAELAGVPPLRWPADRGARATAGAGAGPIHVEVPLGPGVVAAVDAAAAAAGATRFAVLLCHYAGALAEVTGQRDFAVGVPVAQRSGPHLEHAIGCHITMVCVRMRGTALCGDLAAVRETGRLVGHAFAAQDVPFAEVIRLVDPPRTGRPPIYQTLFALQDNAIPRLRLPGLRTTLLRQPYADLPLELHAELWPDADCGGGLRLVISARPEAVPDGIATELAKRFTDRLHTIPSGVRP